MQDETNQEQTAFLNDLNVILGRVTPEEFADPAIETLVQTLECYWSNQPLHQALIDNIGKHESSNYFHEAPVHNLDDMEFVEISTSGCMYEFLDLSKYSYFAKSPNPLSEIIAFYLHLKAERRNPMSHSPLYKSFIKRALNQLAHGALAHVIAKLPKVARHNYQSSLGRVILKEKLFKVVERHLFIYSQLPIEKLESYIAKKTANKDFDGKLKAAQNILQQFYGLTVTCYYEQYTARQTFERMKDIIVDTTRQYLGCNLDALNNSYRDMIFEILSYLDKISAEYLSDPTHFRGLVSIVRHDDSYSNKVTHFTDARFAVARSNRLQLFNNAANDEYANDGAFHEMMTTLESAEKFILMTGWEISPQLKLHRLDDPAGRTLGEILVDKAIANPNMIIAIMVWSQRIPILGNIGARTHANSLTYLQDLCEKRHGRVLPPNFSLQFAHRTELWLGANTHHQKMVIADTGNAWPFVRAFYGGLDLTAGRFDHKHELLLIDDFLDKYHQTRDEQLINRLPNGERPLTHADICNLDKSNPFRTPWHDIHSRVEGTICIDMIEHFRQHWAANCDKLSVDLNNDITAKMREVAKAFMTNANKELLTDFMWKSQLLRSHTRANCEFWSLNSHFENSIMNGYVKLINAAERFIYIENQYFIGGGKNNHDKQRFGNLIPTAIVNKIIAKHQAQQEFHVFIILPLYPEDGPESNTSNEVRRKQHDSMHWLLNEINKHTNNSALNYVSFLWLGEWNGKNEVYDNLAQDRNATREQLIAASRRYPIYVHSKFMIVDDTYVINGSANINERSMMGIRDSEIAILQGPETDKKAECQAMLLAFRKKLWLQYFGEHCLKVLGEEGIANPHTSPAVATIQHYARIHLRCYIENEEGRRPGQGHLMVFPYHAPQDLRPQLVNLPDTPAYYQGSKAFRWMLDRDNLAPDEHISHGGKIIQKWLGNELL